jgi:hypothetical protein
MKETDVIIPINPLVKKDSLQIIIVNSKRGTQVIPIESPRLYSVIVQVLLPLNKLRLNNQVKLLKVVIKILLKSL